MAPDSAGVYHWQGVNGKELHLGFQFLTQIFILLEYMGISQEPSTTGKNFKSIILGNLLEKEGVEIDIIFYFDIAVSKT